jgi:hypothetical protein
MADPYGDYLSNQGLLSGPGLNPKGLDPELLRQITGLLSQTSPTPGLALPAGDMGYGILQDAATAGKYAMGNPDRLTTDQIIPSVVNVASMVMGAGMPMAEVGAVGSAGGRLFHGSPTANLTELVPSSRGPLGPGVYASPLEGIADRYGGTRYQIPDENMDIFRGSGHRTDAEYYGWKSDVQRLKNAVEPEMQADIHPVIDKMWSGDGYPLFARLSQIYGGQEGAQNLFRRAGFKGISGLVDGPETLLFDKVPLR